MSNRTLTRAQIDLLAAADYIEKYGWLKRHTGFDGGPRCIMGAVSSVTFSYSRTQAALDKLSEFLRRNPRNSWWSVPLWNDNACRSAEQAIRVLRSAALQNKCARNENNG